MSVATEIGRNLRTTFQTLAGHSSGGETKQFGAVTVVSACVPTPTFNRVFVLDPFEPADLMAAIDWFTDRGDPFWVTAVETLQDDVADAFGDERYERSDPPQPGMARPLSSVLPAPDAGVQISAVTHETGLDTWGSVAEAVFDFSERTTDLITPTSVLDTADLQYFVGRVDGQPAACGMLSVDESAAGVYVIGVEEAYRRRGIGEAMTWEVLREGRERGAEVGVLQSTQMGYSLYDRMGFETKTKFRHFARESWL